MQKPTVVIRRDSNEPNSRAEIEVTVPPDPSIPGASPNRYLFTRDPMGGAGPSYLAWEERSDLKQRDHWSRGSGDTLPVLFEALLAAHDG